MRLVFVHGIAQQGRSSAILRREWLDALTLGFSKTGIEPPEFDVVVPYFGDELVRVAMDFAVRDDGAEKFIHEAAAEIADAAEARGITPLANDQASDVLDSPFPPPPIGDFEKRGGAMGAALPPRARNVLKNMDRDYPNLTARALRTFLSTVYTYIKSEPAKNIINQIVLDEIGSGTDKPTLLIGHSLGSVVAYNVLHARPKVPWRGFLTLGSPLGIRAIADRLSHKPRIPKIENCWGSHCNASWFNAFDPRDIVALNPLLPPSWDPAESIVNSNHVNNFTENRHGIIGYLSDARIAAAIDALVRSQRKVA